MLASFSARSSRRSLIYLRPLCVRRFASLFFQPIDYIHCFYVSQDTDIEILQQIALQEANQKIQESKLSDACDYWQMVSALTCKLADHIRNEIWDIPTSVVRHLFESYLRSYPTWLQSVSMSTNERPHPILVGDVRAKIRHHTNDRNKKVNAVTLHGYEHAASDILIQQGGEPRLHSMFIMPYVATSEDGAWRSQGFVRFMNRFVGGEHPELFEYELMQPGKWGYSDREAAISRGVAEVLELVLPKIGLFPRKEHHKREKNRVTVSRKSLPSKDIDPCKVVEQDCGFEVGGVLFVGKSQIIRTLAGKIASFAQDERVWVLIEGETGTGKELVAQALHGASPRRKLDMIEVDITLNSELIHSMLFGHGQRSFQWRRV